MNDNNKYLGRQFDNYNTALKIWEIAHEDFLQTSFWFIVQNKQFSLSFSTQCVFVVSMKNIMFAQIITSCVCSESHSSMLIIVFGSLKSKLDQPVSGCDSLTGAVDGPCSGHLALSQVTLAVEVLVEGQVNSLPWLWQTWARSPGCVCHSNNQLF